MHLSAEQLDIASRIDAKVQRLAGEGNDDVGIFVELVDDMPALGFEAQWNGKPG